MLDACLTQRTLRRLLFASALAMPATADVLAVGPSEAFTSVQDAIDAAVDGDVILISSGTYQGATIDDKSLVVLADTAADVELTGIEVRNLNAIRSVSVRGIEIRSNASPYGATLDSNAGPVLLDDVRLGGNGRYRITDCDAVTLVDCEREQGFTYSSGFGATILSTDSNVYLYGGHFRSMMNFGALDVVGGFLFASGATFEGEDAGAGVPAPVGGGCSLIQNGGYAVRLRASASGDPEVLTRDCTLDPGAPYAGSSTCAGEPGVAVIQEAGTYSELEGSAHGFTTTSPVRNGDPFTLTFSGEPGEIAVFLYSVAQAPSYLELLEGALLPSAPLLLTIGALPANGTLELHGVINLPPVLGTLTLYEQGAFLSASKAYLGEPRVAQVLPAP